MFHHPIFSVAIVLILSLLSGAAEAALPQPGTLTPEATVKLVLVDRLRSGDCKKNDRVNFKVDEDICDPRGAVLIRRGTPAYGTVLNSRRAGAWGRRGALDISVEYTTAVDGQRVPLRANKTGRGGGSKALTTAGFLLVAWPLAFCKGSNVTLEAGNSFVAYVDANLVIGHPTDGSAGTSVKAQGIGEQPVNAVAAPMLPPGMKSILMRNGDRLTGKVLGLTAGQYEVETPHGILKVQEDDVVSLTAGATATEGTLMAGPKPVSPIGARTATQKPAWRDQVEAIRSRTTSQ